MKFKKGWQLKLPMNFLNTSILFRHPRNNIDVSKNTATATTAF